MALGLTYGAHYNRGQVTGTSAEWRSRKKSMAGGKLMRKQHPINIRLIDHVVVRVQSLDRMVDFYCDVLGCRVERGPGKMKLIQLRAGNSLIDLVDIAGPLGRDGGGAPDHDAHNMDHFCVQVEPWDATAIALHLKEHGVAVGEPVTRYGALGNGPSLYINDPEGNTIELKGPGSLA
jgi:catechol 2,3-dioxygenase-like lactoylglutathione lyase family enzyme